MHLLWHIYFINICRHTYPDPKDKFVAIVFRHLRPMGFLINSNIHPYLKKRRNLLAAQIPISAIDYGFLDHDSYINCAELFQFEMSELKRYLQIIDNRTKKEIKKAVANSDTIERIYIKLICGK